MRVQNASPGCLFVIFVIVGLLALASCRGATETLAGTSTPKTSALFTITPLPLTAALTLTSTPSPTSLAITPPQVSTPVSTLTNQQLVEYALEELKDNGGCDLPCWWGVIPGETQLQDVKKRFGSALVSASGAYFSIPDSSGIENYSFVLGFGEQDGLIQEIEVEADINESVPSNRFPADWQWVSLDQILTQYGQPTHVQLLAAPPLEPYEPPSSLMWVVYENHGFWILYVERSSYDGTVMRICPSLETVFGVDLLLQSPDSQTPVFQIDPESGSRSLEEATGMNLEEFYNTFKNAGMCLETAPTLPE